MTTGIALLVALACALAFRGAPPMQQPRAGPVKTSTSTSLLTRLRAPLAGLAGVAGWTFFDGSVGVGAGLIAGWVTWRVLSKVESPGAVQWRERLIADVPVAIDLLVAALEAGAAPDRALSLVAQSMGGPIEAEFVVPARQLRLGANPVEVWGRMADRPHLGALGSALRRASETGASVVSAGRRLADSQRETTKAAAEARAKSVSTKAAAPLGLLMLPAFVLLGIVPLVAGLLTALNL